MHVSLFLLTPASFALLASSCCRVWCQLLALVGLNSSIEAGRARPLVRLAALERISDHLGLTVGFQRVDSDQMSCDIISEPRGRTDLQLMLHYHAINAILPTQLRTITDNL